MFVWAARSPLSSSVCIWLRAYDTDAGFERRRVSSYSATAASVQASCSFTTVARKAYADADDLSGGSCASASDGVGRRALIASSRANADERLRLLGDDDRDWRP